MLRSPLVRPGRVFRYDVRAALLSATQSNHANPLQLVKLGPLMERSSGRVETTIALIDGPVAMAHPDLTSATIREIPGRLAGTCARANSPACTHGTFVAGILCARRGSAAPAICPNCTLLVRPIFAEEERCSGYPIITSGLWACSA